LLQAYPTGTGEYLRVLITAATDLQADLMIVPWEVLESTDTKQGLPLGERLSVLRVLLPDQTPCEPLLAGESLRVAILWANPFNDIPGLNEHLQELKTFFDDHPGELALIGPIELTGIVSARESLAEERPHLVYHIGHAVQERGQAVQMVIGPQGSPRHCGVEEFRLLLQQIGPPRLVLLNACATAVGLEQNPYLGAALNFAQQIEAVITMQTMVPARAAEQFAAQLFRDLSNQKGLAESVKRGRLAIQKGEGFCDQPGGSFTPFIPVVLQRTRQDNLFSIDTPAREVAYLLTLLRQRIERIDFYMERAHDKQVRDLLQNPWSAPRVTVITGPSGSGKSTSLRRQISALLTTDNYRAGRRWLYYETSTAPLSARSLEQHIHQLLVSFAGEFPITGGLRNQFVNRRHARPEDALAVFANWLHEEAQEGKNYCVCLDGLPSELASMLAERASRVLTDAGALIILAEAPKLAPKLPIRVLSTQWMNEGEVREALRHKGRPVDAQSVETIVRFSNGLPYFVTGYLRRGALPAGQPHDLAEDFVKALQPGLKENQVEALCFAAMCRTPIPRTILEKLYSRDALQELSTNLNLLGATQGDCYQIPEALREYFSILPTLDRLTLHQNALDEFYTTAEAADGAHHGMTVASVTRWYREALHHALSIAQLFGLEQRDRALEALDVARTIAELLHGRYLGEADEIGAGRAMWEDFRQTAYSLDCFDDRSSDARYAECLMRVSEYEEAEALLEAVADSSELDRILLMVLFLRSNLIKERGRSGELELRIELLNQALDVAKKLYETDDNKRWVKQQIASLEHSLGNALGYGRHARPEAALSHLESAQKLFEELGSPLQFRTVSEGIEIRRYNEELSEEARKKAIATLKQNLRSLITREMRYDAILHLYELGRLESEPASRAFWFQQAHARAANSYAPLTWHAAINWRISQVEGRLATFDEIAPHVEQYAADLSTWSNHAWSRRTRRKALHFLAEHYLISGQFEKAYSAARECFQVVQLIADRGEGQKDPDERHKVARLYGSTALRCGRLAEAREAARVLAADKGIDPANMGSMDAHELDSIFRS